MKKVVLALSVALFAASCNKNANDKDTINNPQNATSLADLTIPQDFNWSSSTKGNLQVNLTTDTTGFTFDGGELQIINEEGEALDRQFVDGNKASFYFVQPQVNSTTYLYYPNTDSKMEISKTGNVEFFIPTNLIGKNLDYFEQTFGDEPFFSKGGSASQGKTAGTNLIVNGDFETNDFTVHNSSFSNVTPGKWFVKSNSKFSWKSANGGRVFESENDDYGYGLQLIDLNGYAGGKYNLTAESNDHRSIIYVYYYTGTSATNLSYLGYCYFPDNVSGNDFNYQNISIPSNATYMAVYILADDNEWFDNVVVDATPSFIDTDNDGVADEHDDYPNDAARAYNSFFPTNGYQTVAFEDLWPSQGDYDFNDMVLSNNITYVRNANNELVEAIITTSLDARGAGHDNGLAIVFTDANGNFVSNNVISGVTGANASLDQDVTNGIIVENNIKDMQSTPYQNNGPGISAEPDEVTFTVSFNSNAGTGSLVTDFYLFRTNQRGLEVHLPGHLPTSAADQSLFGTKYDFNGTYRSETGLPWAIEVVTPDKSFKHPTEKTDILVAYPEFQAWAESGGVLNTDWLLNPVENVIIDLTNFLGL